MMWIYTYMVIYNVYERPCPWPILMEKISLSRNHPPPTIEFYVGTLYILYDIIEIRRNGWRVLSYHCLSHFPLQANTKRNHAYIYMVVCMYNHLSTIWMVVWIYICIWQSVLLCWLHVYVYMREPQCQCIWIWCCVTIHYPHIPGLPACVALFRSWLICNKPSGIFHIIFFFVWFVVAGVRLLATVSTMSLLSFHAFESRINSLHQKMCVTRQMAHKKWFCNDEKTRCLRSLPFSATMRSISQPPTLTTARVYEPASWRAAKQRGKRKYACVCWENAEKHDFRTF